MHKTTSDLTGVRVVITRPAPEGADLCRAISAEGGEAIAYPTLEIQPLPVRQPRPNSDITLFISRNAVRYGVEAYPALKQSGVGGLLAAVGGGTAATLLQLSGRSVDLVPSHRFDSEGLLSLPELQQLHGKVIHILKGEGGRALLQQQLSARGAEVVTTDCYQRALPTHPAPSPWLQANPIDLVITTSNGSLENLIELTPPTHRHALLQSPIMVVSSRGSVYAQQLGFSLPAIVASGADTASLMLALQRWHQHGRVTPRASR